MNRLGAWRSDHDIFQTFEGDNTVLLQQVAGLLLKRYKDRFTKAPVRATYSYMRDWAADKLPANPLTSHETDARHLRDPAFLRAALRHALLCFCAGVLPACQSQGHINVAINPLHFLSSSLLKNPA